MAILKLVMTIAITMAITISHTMRATITTTTTAEDQNLQRHQEAPNKETLIPPKRFSRFLAQSTTEKPRNPNAADHCNKNPEVCSYQQGLGNSTACCNNKCVDLDYDDKNCGGCKNKCKFSQVCCRGQCVYSAYDKRHCGECNHRCESGEFCVYGMCNYA